MTSFRFSLSFAILSSLTCLLLLTWLLLSLVPFKTAEQDLLWQKREEIRLLLSSYVDLLSRDLESENGNGAAARFAERLSKNPDFLGLTAVDSAGNTILAIPQGVSADSRLTASREEALDVAAEGKLSASAPVKLGKRVVGEARLTFSLVRDYRRLERSRHLFATYFILDFLLLLGFGSFILSRLIVVPMKKLLTATQRITQGDLSHRVHVPGSAEIGELCESFNAMAEALTRKDEEVARNLRSLEEANRELVEARAEAIRSEKMASVGILAAGMAHEIGTPLAAIMGYTTLLGDELAADREKSDYLRRIAEDCGRIDRTVRDLLDYARPRPAAVEEVALQSFIPDLLAMLTAQGVFRRVSATGRVDEALPPLFTDPHQLRQVLVNMAINARDAMPEGGEFTIDAGREGDDIVIRVSDTGEGVPEEYGDRIFDPFFTTKEPGKGTGLGLAISSRIIDSLGGSIRLERPQVGTALTIRLPAGGREGGRG